jgi:hypothetical protein
MRLAMYYCNRMKTILSIFTFLIISNSIFAQRSIYGYVQDSASGERIVNAYVKVYGEDVSTTSNSFGYFTLKTNKDSCLLLISNPGFENQAKLVLINEPMPLLLVMSQTRTLKGAVVKSKKDDKIVNSTQMSSVSITMAQIKMLPRFFGEADVIKAIQLMPGIKGGSEGSSGLYVRGGDQTKI